MTWLNISPSIKNSTKVYFGKNTIHQYKNYLLIIKTFLYVTKSIGLFAII